MASAVLNTTTERFPDGIEVSAGVTHKLAEAFSLHAPR